MADQLLVQAAGDGQRVVDGRECEGGARGHVLGQIEEVLVSVAIPKADHAALAGGAEEGGPQRAVPQTADLLAQALGRRHGNRDLRQQNSRGLYYTPKAIFTPLPPLKIKVLPPNLNNFFVIKNMLKQNGPDSDAVRNLLKNSRIRGK